MGELEPRISGLNLPVGDLGVVVAFYREVLGALPLHQEPDLAVFRLGPLNVALRAEPGHRGPAEAVLALARRGIGQLTVAVDDVGAAAVELVGRSATLISGPADQPWGIRTVTFADPAGYVWELAQDLG